LLVRQRAARREVSETFLDHLMEQKLTRKFL
jgi:hypothetical protein